MAEEKEIDLYKKEVMINVGDIKEIAVRLTTGNAICALSMTDTEDENIMDIEWENCDIGRSEVVYAVPEGHELIGLQANTTASSEFITRLAFVFKKIKVSKKTTNG